MMLSKGSDMSDASWQRWMALARWENEGGARARDTQQVLIFVDKKTEHALPTAGDAN